MDAQRQASITHVALTRFVDFLAAVDVQPERTPHQKCESALD